MGKGGFTRGFFRRPVEHLCVQTKNEKKHNRKENTRRIRGKRRKERALWTLWKHWHPRAKKILAESAGKRRKERAQALGRFVLLPLHVGTWPNVYFHRIDVTFTVYGKKRKFNSDPRMPKADFIFGFWTLANEESKKPFRLAAAPNPQNWEGGCT